jgi:SAM-dependent methyltransferase
MEDNSLANHVKPYCKSFNTIIDIGCRAAVTLVDFEELGFKKLIGIDINLKYAPLYQYSKILAYKNIPHDKNTQEFRNEFQKKYFFREIDYKNYPFEQELYSFIICKNFLHFFSDEEKYSLIERLYGLLEPQGILYIRVNHIYNNSNTDPTKMIDCGNNTYEIKGRTKQRRYLIKPNYFIEKMSKYPQIDELFLCDDMAVSIAIRKH